MAVPDDAMRLKLESLEFVDLVQQLPFNDLAAKVERVARDVFDTAALQKSDGRGVR